MTVGSIVMMVALGLVSLIGLFAAANAVDIGMALFGSVLTLFGVGMIFWLLKRHFDEQDAAAAAAGSGQGVFDRVA
ncbi:MAG TPA: hypothetical protein VMQ11_16545 [Alphaproteobacteria bacterium]|nr:hypothetical protein [Alphaproteobacteria bacterium]